MTDDLAVLRLQIEWGADEALGPEPRDRRRMPAAPMPRRAEPIPATPIPATPILATPVPATPVPATPSPYASVEAVDAALLATGGAGLAVTARHFVGVRGRVGARALILGDCPGESEERTGVAFSGEAGRLLATMLASAGIDPDDCAFGYVVPWRPPGGRPPSEVEVGVCAPLLLARLACVRLSVVVACAAAAARVLLGGAAGARSRGRLLTADVPGVGPLSCLVLQSPEQAWASGRGKAQAWAAMRLLRRTLDAASTK